VPTSDTDAVIAATGAKYVVTSKSLGNTAGSLAVSSRNATVQVSAGSLSIAGGLNVTAGILKVTAGSLTANTVNYQGKSLDIVARSRDASITVQTGMTVTNAAGNGPGTINLTPQRGLLESTLVFDNTQTFDDATINMGGTFGNIALRGWLAEIDTTGAGATLTLGPHVTINAISGSAYIADNLTGNSSDGYPGDTIVNQGTMNATRGVFDIITHNFTNQGTINFNTNGHVSFIDVRTFLNASGATIDAGSKSYVICNFGSITNAGTIATMEGARLVFADPIDNTSTGVLAAGSGSTLFFEQGTINSGSIQIASANFAVLGPVTLSGGGDVVLTGSGAIVAPDGPGTLDNVDNTISGNGTIGGANLTLLNSGLIKATGTGDVLALKTGPNTITNDGSLLALSGGHIQIVSALSNTGLVKADGLGSEVSLRGGTNAGTAEAVNNGELVLDNTTNSGTVVAESGGTVLLVRHPTNTGKIDLLSGGADTSKLVIDGEVVLKGGGNIALSGGSTITSDGAPASLNNVDNTISGNGTIGDSHLTLVNNAVIKAAVGGDVLNINTGANGVINHNEFLAQGGGQLDIASRTRTTLLVRADASTVDLSTDRVSNGGRIEAINGGKVAIAGNVKGSVPSADLLASNGGELDVLGKSAGGTATISGSNSLLQFSANSTVSTKFATGAAGTLELNDCHTFLGTISGFTLGDFIDLRDMGFTAGTTRFSYTPDASDPSAGGVLKVTDDTTIAKLQLLGQYTASSFVLSSDGQGGTRIADPVADHTAVLASSH
jgi:hypothetical protein